MDNKPLFETNRDRSDFFIALAVIAFFLWLFLFSGIIGNKKNLNINPAVAATIDTDKDGVIDELDRCPDLFGNSASGCPVDEGKDSDGDGVVDARDICPNLFGEKENGCPLASTDDDLDGDGIENTLDDCPKIAGPKSNNGCPEISDTMAIDKNVTPIVPLPVPKVEVQDKDGDGIADNVDACPDKKGSVATKGCPDSDGDGVIDSKDQCPDEKGVMDNNGCPELVLEEEEQTIMDEAVRNVEFEYGSAQLTKNSETILDKVVDIMERHPESKLRIEGHTDNDSNSDFNLNLSQKRANSAKAYLVSKGINAARINAIGLGETQPVASNETEEGRMKNRRVEFDLK